MGSHQSSRMVSDVWLTPPAILAALGDFDLDPCSPADRPWPTAARHISLPDDGLAADWSGRVFLNPPYSREATKWLAKLAKHGNGIALIFARTETAWFREHVWMRATAILFLDGRIHFHHADGTRAAANAGAPSCLVAFGLKNYNALICSNLDGHIITGWTPTGRVERRDESKRARRNAKRKGRKA